MSLEVQRFTIPSEVTNGVMEEANGYEDTLEYAKGVMAKARINDSALYGYLANTSKEQGGFWYSYSIAAALSYDIVTRRLAELGLSIEIDEDDIVKQQTLSDSTFNDPRWQDELWVLKRVNTKDGIQADSGISFFLNLLDLSAPEFAEEINSMVNQVEVPANRIHVLRGFFDGYMPFYTKILRQAERQPDVKQE